MRPEKGTIHEEKRIASPKAPTVFCSPPLLSLHSLPNISTAPPRTVVRERRKEFYKAQKGSSKTHTEEGVKWRGNRESPG